MGAIVGKIMRMSIKISTGYDNPADGMKKLFLLILCGLFLGPTRLWALEEFPPEKLVGAVQAAYEKTQDLTMDFSQKTYVALLEEEVQKKGEAQFKKPGKFRIEYEDKRGKTYLCDGKTLWIIRRGDDQVTQVAAGEQNIPAEALSFLGGFGKLKQDFAVESVDPKKAEQLKIDRKNYQWLELTPLKKQSQIDWLVVGFDPKDRLARVLYIYTDSGNLSQYLFSNLRANGGLPEESFIYKKNKN
jgi:outer membrane lipoprotein-sorting protein